ncbi:MAG: hypothetical protein ABSH20_15565 [Tepidisphaeraceae bacterium]|jgi:ribosomal protein L37E
MSGAAINRNGEIYCRKCGHDLRWQTDPHRCPKCGLDFDPADFTTYRTRSPDDAGLWWAKRVSFGVLVLLVAIAVFFWQIIRWLADMNLIEAP